MWRHQYISEKTFIFNLDEACIHVFLYHLMRKTCLLILTKFYQDCTIYNKVKLVRLCDKNVHFYMLIKIWGKGNILTRIQLLKICHICANKRGIFLKNEAGNRSIFLSGELSWNKKWRFYQINLQIWSDLTVRISDLLAKL